MASITVERGTAGPCVRKRESKAVSTGRGSKDELVPFKASMKLFVGISSVDGVTKATIWFGYQINIIRE